MSSENIEKLKRNKNESFMYELFSILLI